MLLRHIKPNMVKRDLNAGDGRNGGRHKLPASAMSGRRVDEGIAHHNWFYSVNKTSLAVGKLSLKRCLLHHK